MKIEIVVGPVNLPIQSLALVPVTLRMEPLYDEDPLSWGEVPIVASSRGEPMIGVMQGEEMNVRTRRQLTLMLGWR